MRYSGTPKEIEFSDVVEVANKVGYPQDIKDKLCRIVYENIQDNYNGKADEDDIRNNLLYYYIQEDDKIYFDMLRPLEEAVPGEVHPMTADDFVFETMVENLTWCSYDKFDTTEKIEKIGRNLVQDMIW